MRLILKENSFKFNDKHFLQTHGIAIGTKMAVVFTVIFMAHIEKQKNLSSGRDLLMTFFQCGFCPKKKSATSLISPIHFTTRSNSCTKCHQKKFFSLILKFSKNHVSLTTKLWMFKHITSLQKRFNIRISLQVTLSV